jgi:hypothetical protein
VTGLSTEEFARQSRRTQLPVNEQQECAALDRSMPVLNGQVKAAAPRDRAAFDVELYKARKRFNDLNC